MGQILHGYARTTEATRCAIQNSQESLRVLARRYGINPKTVAKWRKREATRDLAMGPKLRGPTAGEEAMIAAVRKHTPLLLDDCLYTLQETIRHLTRGSSPHRCLHRHGISRLPALREHLDVFMCAYNFARRLKALKGLTPYRFIVKSWADNPNAFLRDPSQF